MYSSEFRWKSYELIHFITKMVNFSSFTVTFSYLPCGCLILLSIDMGTKKFWSSTMDQAMGTGFQEQELYPRPSDIVSHWRIGEEAPPRTQSLHKLQWWRHCYWPTTFGTCTCNLELAHASSPTICIGKYILRRTSTWSSISLQASIGYVVHVGRNFGE